MPKVEFTPATPVGSPRRFRPAAEGPPRSMSPWSWPGARSSPDGPAGDVLPVLLLLGERQGLGSGAGIVLGLSRSPASRREAPASPPSARRESKRGGRAARPLPGSKCSDGGGMREATSSAAPVPTWRRIVPTTPAFHSGSRRPVAARMSPTVSKSVFLAGFGEHPEVFDSHPVQEVHAVSDDGPVRDRPVGLSDRWSLSFRLRR